MQIYTQDKTVTKEDLDQLNHVNNVRYVQWVQDIAEAHWQQKASTRIRSDYFWVLLNHHIDYNSPAFLNDIITIKTYVAKSEGVTSNRIVEMYLKVGKKLIVRSETKWCLIAVETNKPTRITETISNLFK